MSLNTVGCVRANLASYSLLGAIVSLGFFIGSRTARLPVREKLGDVPRNLTLFHAFAIFARVAQSASVTDEVWRASLLEMIPQRKLTKARTGNSADQ